MGSEGGLTLRSLICRGLASDCSSTCMSLTSSPSGRGWVTSSAASFAASSNWPHPPVATREGDEGMVKASMKRGGGHTHQRQILRWKSSEFVCQLSIKAGKVPKRYRELELAQVVMSLQLLSEERSISGHVAHSAHTVQPPHGPSVVTV